MDCRFQLGVSRRPGTSAGFRRGSVPALPGGNSGGAVRAGSVLPVQSSVRPVWKLGSAGGEPVGVCGNLRKLCALFCLPLSMGVAACGGDGLCRRSIPGRGSSPAGSPGQDRLAALVGYRTAASHGQRALRCLGCTRPGIASLAEPFRRESPPGKGYGGAGGGAAGSVRRAFCPGKRPDFQPNQFVSQLF